MAFGSGYSVTVDHSSRTATSVRTGARVARILGQASQVAHVWAQQTQTFGQNSKGTLYFEGGALYSYGRHYMIGFIMPESGAISGAAILNSTSSSPTTNGHRSDARRAVSGFTLHAPDIEDIRDILRDVARDGFAATDCKAEMSRYLVKHRADLDDATANYLGALVGLKPVNVAKLRRDADTAAAKAAKVKAAADLDAAHERAIWLADKTDSAFRRQIAYAGTEYSDYRLRALSKELKAARGLMLKAKSGKLKSKARLATIRARIKLADSAVATHAEMRQPRLNRQALASAITTVRGWTIDSVNPAAWTWHRVENVRQAAETIAARGRTRLACVAGANLADMAKIGTDLITAENERLRLLERERAKLAAAERIALWYAGERVGRVDFDAATGGAALRIVGDILETSHGASVPLAHAVKVFQFVKLCRDKGTPWKRNGKTIRVGHFQVDSIAANGDFVAGCHSFTWTEIERVAKSANLFDVAPSAEAVELTNA